MFEFLVFIGKPNGILILMLLEGSVEGYDDLLLSDITYLMFFFFNAIVWDFILLNSGEGISSYRMH